MHVRFREVDPFNCWVWLRFSEIPGQGERNYVDGIFEFDLDDPQLQDLVEPELLAQAVEDLDLLEAAGAELDLELVHAGELTPVFFGSAMTNFGVRPFLDDGRLAQLTSVGISTNHSVQRVSNGSFKRRP